VEVGIQLIVAEIRIDYDLHKNNHCLERSNFRNVPEFGFAGRIRMGGKLGLPEGGLWLILGFMREIWSQLKPWVEAGQPFVLATVVGAARPAPRGVGAVMAIHPDGEQFIGSVSAGCVEIEVLEAARACLVDRETRHAVFDGEHGFPWEVSMSCGGNIRVRVDWFDPGEGRGEALAGILESEEKGLHVKGPGIEAMLDGEGVVLHPAAGLSGAALETARGWLTAGRSTAEADSPEGPVLFRVVDRPSRFFMIGAVHITVHLVGLARACGYEVVVIDPREVYAREDRFPTKPHRLIHGWPGRVLPEFKLNPTDCAAVVTHDPKIDDDALRCLLAGDCGYVGALGSRRNHAARLRRLGKEMEPATLSRIHGPIGLDIGSETPAEIAISIMAEVIQKRGSSS
jgi:xanthine dehydrogenase accessory factor